MPRELKDHQKLEITIGKNIETLRLAAGMSRSELARKIDVSNFQVSKYEKGTNKISIARLALLADVFETSITYFFEQKNTSVNKEQRLCMELVRNFSKIKDSRLRKTVNNLARDLATINITLNAK